MEEEAAWSRLPHANPELPSWAKILAGPLPKTTARMLELDYIQREKNPLGKEFSSLLRWTVAAALKSPFGMRSAEEDIRKANPSSTFLSCLGEPAKLPRKERLAAEFAKKLTLEGHAVTDDEFAAVLQAYGPEKTTAIVHSVAYANFLNRVVLGLGAEGAPTPAISLKFPPDKFEKIQVPERPPWDDLKNTAGPGLALRPDWDGKSTAEIDESLEKQKARPSRIPLPDPSRFDKLPPKEKEHAMRVRWTTVSAGYQPEMARSWAVVRAMFLEEAKKYQVLPLDASIS